MNNSDHTLFIESGEEDEEKELHKDEENDSDSSDEIHQQNKPNSYNIQWPQSYRQSIDLYSSVPSPSIGFLETPSLTRLGSSFFSSSLTRRHTSETLPTETTAPLLIKGEDEQVPQHRHSCHYLSPPIPSRRSSYLKKDDKSTKTSSEHHPISRDSTFAQTVFNGINILCGVGMLSTPYAVKEGGWVGLSILVIFGVLSFYTGILLRHCLDSHPELETYPDIGQAAFGKLGRIAISILLYVELYGCCIEYVILESDNLSSLFPNAHISLGGFELNSNVLFAIATTLAVLPTCWLRDLTILSYISAGGVIASILISVCLLWIGLVDDIGFNNKGTTLNLSTFPVAIGLYGFCYSGHSIVPNIYSSMAKPKQFSAALLTCFGICTALYAGIAVMGYKMFGESIQSQFTLNLPQNLVATKIAVWTTVVNPFTKYALTMTPVAMSLEELIPSNKISFRIYSIIIRTLLVISTLLVGLSIPFFGLVMSLIGSLLAMLITLIVPCACYLSILRKKVTRVEVVFCLIIIVVGVITAVIGSYSAIKKIIESL